MNANEVLSPSKSSGNPNELQLNHAWKILCVDDDSLFRNTTAFALEDLVVETRSIQIVQARSFAEASAILSANSDIVVVLLDIVMETEDAGFRLVRAIREILGNAIIRIVILTGQPGFSNMQDSFDRFDINDYWTKNELTADRLRGIVTSNIRSYAQLQTIEQAKKGLQMIVESSNVLSSTRNVDEFTVHMITEIAALLGVPPEGIVCVSAGNPATRIIGAAGSFVSLNRRNLDELKDPVIKLAIVQALEKRTSIFTERDTVLYFPDDLAGENYVAYIATGRMLSETDVELLRVFTQNIGKGLFNISLFSQLDRMAYEDSLVGLPNRNALIREIEHHRSSKDYSLLMIDIDRFSEMNIAFGVEYGDRVLRAFGQNLRNSIDPTIMMSRINSDLFALLGPTEKIVSERLEERLKEWMMSGFDGVISASTVLYELTGNGSNAVEVITGARLALKQAKRHGLAQHSRFQKTVDEEARRRYTLLQALIHALHEHEITIALQPQIDLATGKIIGAEALARWTNAKGEFISPGVFIPLAEATGLILELGNHILDLVLQSISELRLNGYEKIRVAFNASMLQLMQPGFAGNLIQKMNVAQIPAEQLELEVTESVAMENFEAIAAVLHDVKQAGIQVAIDDFGTGFSSLAYLKKLPAHRLKIDRAFVEEIGSDEGELSISEAIIGLAHRLGMQTVAEGIETEEQKNRLKELGCEEGQGYLFARPMKLSELVGFIGKGNV